MTSKKILTYQSRLLQQEKFPLSPHCANQKCPPPPPFSHHFFSFDLRMSSTRNFHISPTKIPKCKNVIVPPFPCSSHFFRKREMLTSPLYFLCKKKFHLRHNYPPNLFFNRDDLLIPVSHYAWVRETSHPERKLHPAHKPTQKQC